jgi:hypothetical protein
MVQTFQTITTALKQKKGVSTSKALSNASRAVLKSTTSSSGKLYAQNLKRASEQFKGQSINPASALALLQTLIGGEQAGSPKPSPSGGDLLSGLMGSLAGGGQAAAEQGAQPGSGDLLGALMGSLAGGGQAPAPQASQPGSGDLLGALMGSLTGSAGAQPPSAGGDLVGSLLGGLLGGGSGGGLDSLMQAFLGGSGMGEASHRKDSTQLVINAFLQALGGLKK